MPDYSKSLFFKTGDVVGIGNMNSPKFRLGEVIKVQRVNENRLEVTVKFIFPLEVMEQEKVYEFDSLDIREGRDGEDLKMCIVTEKMKRNIMRRRYTQRRKRRTRTRRRRKRSSLR